MAKSAKIVKMRRANRRGIVLGILVVLLLAAVFTVGILKLRKQNRELAEQKKALEEQVALESEMKEYLESLEAESLSREEIEDLVRERFGLVYPDEIIFVPDPE